MDAAPARSRKRDSAALGRAAGCALPTDALPQVLSFLPYGEQTRLQVCSRLFRRAARFSRVMTPPVHVLGMVDRAVRTGDVRRAETILRPFIAWSLFERTHVPYVNRYVCLVRRDVLPGGHLRDVFDAAACVFQKKALRELVRCRRCVLPGRVQDFDAVAAMLARASCSGVEAAKPAVARTTGELGDGAGLAESAVCACEEAVEYGRGALPASAPQIRATYSASRAGVEGTCMTAFLLGCRGRFAEATDLARHAVQWDSESSLARWVLGLLLRDSGPREACRLFADSIRLCPDFASGYFSLAMLTCRVGRASGPAVAARVNVLVEALLATCVALDPAHHLAIKMQGDGSRAAALRRMLRVFTMHPSDVHAARSAYRLLLEDARAGDEEHAAECMHLAFRMLAISTSVNPTGMRGCGWADLGHLHLFARKDPAGAFTCYANWEKCTTADDACRAQARRTQRWLLDRYFTPADGHARASAADGHARESAADGHARASAADEHARESAATGP